MENLKVLTRLGLGALTLNSVLAVYRSRGESGTVAFVVGAYAAILLLFHFLRKLERQGRRDARGRLKAAVWILTTLLTVMFACRVAALTPPLVAVLVWLMSAATVAAGFWAFFITA